MIEPENNFNNSNMNSYQLSQIFNLLAESGALFCSVKKYLKINPWKDDDDLFSLLSYKYVLLWWDEIPSLIKLSWWIVDFKTCLYWVSI